MYRVEANEMLKSTLAIKSLVQCTHFLAGNHIAHTTDLVVTCGGEGLKRFMKKVGRNAH